MFYTVFAFVVALSVALATTTNTAEVEKTPFYDRFDALLKKVGQKANLKDAETHALTVQTNLRAVNEESTRFLQGFLFIAEYSGATCDDSDFKRLTIIRLNQCFAANDKVESRKARAWVTVNGNLGMTYNSWSDDQCKLNFEKEDEYAPLNTCFYGTKLWTGPLPDHPFSFLTGSVGFFQTADIKQCINNHEPGENFDYVEFYRYNTCIPYEGEDSYRDSMITGCDENGVQLDRYFSEDGSCTLGSYPRLYNPKNVCVWYDIYWDLNFGWTRYQCL